MSDTGGVRDRIEEKLDQVVSDVQETLLAGAIEIAEEVLNAVEAKVDELQALLDQIPRPDQSLPGDGVAATPETPSPEPPA